MRRQNFGIFNNMDTFYVFIFLFIVQRLSVNGQMLVSHKEGVLVTASSQYFPYNKWDINHVVDNITAFNAWSCKCCGATNNEKSPWYELDLGKEYNIQRIHVKGRENNFHYLHNMTIQLGTTEADGTELQGVDTSKTDLRELNYTLPYPERARFITLTLRDITEYFVICELYVYAICNTGTYGPNCVNACGKCNNNDTCDNITGDCSECINGYESPQCKECIDGRYSSSCVGKCGHCKNNDRCDKNNGSCPNGCSVGYQGNTCTQECEDGTYGLDCQGTCGNCLNNGSCNKINGSCDLCAAGYEGNSCVDECEDGTYGLDCQETCGNCLNNESCNKINGACVVCAAGYKGNSCVDACENGTFGENCTQTCGNCLNDTVCDPASGECEVGCMHGYLSPYCVEECEDGKYGLDCQETCGYCFNNAPCNKIHGGCVTCAAGYKGNSCVDECVCGMCLDEDVCDIYTGECPQGCTDGYKGSQCSQKTNQDISSTCISIPVFIGSLFAVIFINTTGVYLWMRYRNILHKKTQNAANNANTSIELPNTPSNYDTLELDNLDEESRYTELNRRS